MRAQATCTGDPNVPTNLTRHSERLAKVLNGNVSFGATIDNPTPSGQYTIHAETLVERRKWQAPEANLHCGPGDSRWRSDLCGHYDLDENHDYVNEHYRKHAV